MSRLDEEPRRYPIVASMPISRIPYRDVYAANYLDAEQIEAYWREQLAKEGQLTPLPLVRLRN
jgi:hypothetical protein